MQLINRPLALLLAGLAVTTVNAQENKRWECHFPPMFK